MSRRTLTNIQEATDLVWGLALLGTGGGGGRLSDGVELLRSAISEGLPIEVVDLEDLPADTWTVSVASLGGRDPDQRPSPVELAAYGLVEERLGFVDRLVEAIRTLAAYARVRIGAVVSFELGSANTVGSLIAAARLGIPCASGDYVGRAVPEFPQTKAEILGLPVHPAALVDRWGNRLIVESAASSAMLDRLGRQISVAAFGGGVGTAGCLYPVQQARQAVVPGSLATAQRVGRALRQGAADRAIPRALSAVAGARVLFEGEAVRTDWASEEAYTYRVFDYWFRGTGADTGRTARIWVKNEHHVVWRDEDVVATSPDLIAVVDAESGAPLSTRGDVVPGRPVLVIGLPVLDSLWRTEAGLHLLGPRHFGFDVDYVPLEERPQVG